MTSPKRYVFLLTGFLGLFSVLTVSINYLTDPYLVLDSLRIKGFNLYKVEIDKHVRTSKAYYPLKGHWDTILIGNSRIELGLNPKHACFQKSGSKVYNLGIPGLGVRGQLEYALNIIYQQPIERVLLSLDFVDFLVRKGRPPPTGEIEWNTPSSSRLRYSFDGSLNPEYDWTRFVDYYRVLFSLDALFDSLKTIILQADSAADRDEQGFNPGRNFEHGVAIEGPYAFFSQKMASLDEKYQKGWSLSYSDGTLSRGFTYLHEFLEIAASRGIEVILFTNPFHEMFWDMLRENRLYKLHQVWLTLVQDSISTADLPGIYMWDFSADSDYIHETVPAKGVKTKPLNWFWEPAHYRKELGDLMLDAMLADECGSTAKFGKKIL